METTMPKAILDSHEGVPRVIFVVCPACGAHIGIISNDTTIEGRITFICRCGVHSVVE